MAGPFFVEMPETAADLSPAGASPDVVAGADLIAEAAALSNEEIAERLEGAFAQLAAAEGAIVVLMGEVARRQASRDEGATATEPWAVERFGISTPTARALTHVGELAWDLPHLVGSLCAGEVSLDKVRAVADVATPETDRELLERARTCSVRQLADIARSTKTPARRHLEPVLRRRPRAPRRPLGAVRPDERPGGRPRARRPHQRRGRAPDRL